MRTRDPLYHCCDYFACRSYGGSVFGPPSRRATSGRPTCSSACGSGRVRLGLTLQELVTIPPSKPNPPPALCGQAAIVPGFVYWGSVAELRGKYVFADLVPGRIFYADAEEMHPGAGLVQNL